MIIAKKMDFDVFEEHATKNELVKDIIKPSNDLLDQPVCERCEQLALHSQNGTYTCPSCGHVGHTKTVLRDYIIQEIKHYADAARQAADFTDFKNQILLK